MMFDEKVLEEIRSHLMDKKESVAAAESVTSGLLQTAFSTAKDASCFFQGGITAYNLGQKARHLHIDPIHADSCDCVSPAIAETMALEVAKMFACDWGIGICGYATITTDTNDHLFAHYAISHRGKIADSGEIKSTVQEGFDTQAFYVNQLLSRFTKQF